jgi:hypothetical protein
MGFITQLNFHKLGAYFLDDINKQDYYSNLE